MRPNPPLQPTLSAALAARLTPIVSRAGWRHRLCLIKRNATKMDRDALLILAGAGIGFVSSVGTSLFQAWLNRREYKNRQEYERRQSLRQIQTASIQDIQRYGRTEQEPIVGARPKLACSILVVGLVILISLLVLINNPVITSIAIGIAVFVIVQAVLSLFK